MLNACLEELILRLLALLVLHQLIETRQESYRIESNFFGRGFAAQGLLGTQKAERFSGRFRILSHQLRSRWRMHSRRNCYCREPLFDRPPAPTC